MGNKKKRYDVDVNNPFISNFVLLFPARNQTEFMIIIVDLVNNIFTEFKIITEIILRDYFE